jgi:hypothetical protein
VQQPDVNDQTAQMSLLDRHALIVTRLRAGTLAVQDYRREFARFSEQREAVYKELDARVCEILNQRWGLKWPERAITERAILTRAMFLGLIYDYMLVRMDSKSHGSFGDDVMDYFTTVFWEMVKDTTSRDLTEYAETIRGLPQKSGRHIETEPCATDRAHFLGRSAKELDRTLPSTRSHRRHLLKR